MCEKPEQQRSWEQEGRGRAEPQLWSMQVDVLDWAEVNENPPLMLGATRFSCSLSLSSHRSSAQNLNCKPFLCFHLPVGCRLSVEWVMVTGLF